MSSIRVQLQQFEGPLDLLLYLIRKEEMDIFNINIVEITKQYLDFIKLMKEFDLEVAGDFIAMASTLIQIKSKMLLPQYDENGEIVENIDPRKELVQKLIEYEKFKEASKALYERPLLNRDVWARGFREKLEVTNDEIELEENALFSLISSYRKTIKALYKKVHKVNVKLQSIAGRILEMSTKLIPGSTVRMVDLFTQDISDRIERSRNALITFLSLLELGKMGYVGLYQTETYGDIHVRTNKPIEGDVVSRVEEYGVINADQVAESLFAKSIRSAEEEFALLEKEEETASAQAAAASTATGVMDQLDFLENLNEELALEEAATDEELLVAEAELNYSETNLDSVENMTEDATVETTEFLADHASDSEEVADQDDAGLNTVEQNTDSVAEYNIDTNIDDNQPLTNDPKTEEQV